MAKTDTIEVYSDGIWYKIKDQTIYGEIGGREYQTNVELVASAFGSGAIAITSPIRLYTTFTLSLAFIGEQLPNEQRNYTDGILSRVSAIRINGYTARAIIELTGEELYERKISGMTNLNYKVTLLDPYWWSSPYFLIGNKENATRALAITYRAKSYDADESTPYLVKNGVFRWRLTIYGQPTLIIVQAISIGQVKAVYAFSASEIVYSDPELNQIIVDNYALAMQDMKKFVAIKASGEEQNLNRFVDAIGSGYFDLPFGSYEFKVYLGGEYSDYTLEIYRGDNHVPHYSRT